MQNSALQTQLWRSVIKPFVWSFLIEHALVGSQLIPSDFPHGWDYQAHGGDWENQGVCMHNEVHKQSPIDLPDGMQPDMSENMYYLYPLLGDPVKLTNDGHGLVFTLPFTYKGGFGIAESPEQIFEGAPLTYRLWHVTFHSPSEHTRNGVRLPLEVQLTHKEAITGQLAVVSVFFTDGGQPHNFLNVMMEYGLPTNSWDEVFVNRAAVPPSSMSDTASKSDKIIDFRSLVHKGAFYKYEGSLTLPPCNPGVQWLVRGDPIVAEAQQLSAFRNLLMALNPPQGNFRTIQFTGERVVKLISSVDINNPSVITTVAISPAAPPPAVADNVNPNTEITGNPEFDGITGNETAEVLQAKQQYQAARLSAEGAKVAYIKAKADLAQAQDLYDNAPGVVEKIDLKWVIIDKTNILNSKSLGMVKALEKYTAALNNCVAVVASHKGEAVPTTTPIPTEAGSTDTATTRLPTEFPPKPTVIPGYKLNYSPDYNLPRGPVGNPFVRRSPESSVRVGGISGQYEYFPYLKQNLNQPEGSETWNVPVPSLVKVTTTTEPPPTTAPPATIDLKINIKESSISNMTAFKEELAVGLASAAGVNASRVLIANVTETKSSVGILLQTETALQRVHHTGTARLRGPRNHGRLVTFDWLSPQLF
jgi:carbonic anhydrase